MDGSHMNHMAIQHHCTGPTADAGPDYIEVVIGAVFDGMLSYGIQRNAA